MTPKRTYSDEQLLRALAASTSWRGLLRQLGLSGTSAAAMRSVRTRADRLGADYSHFTGMRRWTEDELREAVAAASTWSEAAEALGLRGGSAVATVKGHAVRLGVECQHLNVDSFAEAELGASPDIGNLRRAGPLLAAAWFTLCGYDISWPLEPSRYDLVVCAAGKLRRVQVKTTTVRVAGTWKAYLSTSRQERMPYDPGEIDDFFIIDGALGCYVVPVAAVGGLHAIHLAAYSRYRVGQMSLGEHRAGSPCGQRRSRLAGAAAPP